MAFAFVILYPFPRLCVCPNRSQKRKKKNKKNSLNYRRIEIEKSSEPLNALRPKHQMQSVYKCVYLSFMLDPTGGGGSKLVKRICGQIYRGDDPINAKRCISRR